MEPWQDLTSLGGGLGWAPGGHSPWVRKEVSEKLLPVNPSPVPAQGMAGAPSKHQFFSTFPALPAFHPAKGLCSALRDWLDLGGLGAGCVLPAQVMDMQGEQEKPLISGGRALAGTKPVLV